MFSHTSGTRIKTGPDRPGIFYGWWVVAACLLMNLFTGGIVFYGFTAVFEPLANEFSWSYAQISLASSIRGLEAGLFAPLIGLVVDRWGAKKLMITGAIIGGAGLVLLSRTNSLLTFYGAFVLVSIGMSTSTSTVTMTAVAKWFRRKISLAMGVVVSGFAVGGLMIPIVTILIDRLGWRNAVAVLGIGLWVVGLTLPHLIRHRPEDYGLLPDGDTRPLADPQVPKLKNTQPKVEGMSAKEALSSRVFWYIGLMAFYQGFAVNAVVTHVMPYFSSINIARTTAALMASAIPLSSLVGRLGFGWLGDKFEKRRVAALAIALLVTGFLFFGLVPNMGIWLLIPVCIFFGIGWGGAVPIRPALLSAYFGRARIGMMIGFAYGTAMLGQLVGAPLAGWLFDKWGDYQRIWFLFTAVGAVALVTILTMPALKETPGSLPQN